MQAHFVSFARSVLQATSLAEKERLCRQIANNAKSIPLGDFTFLFAGVLHASKGCWKSAVSLLARASANCFARHLKEFIVTRKSLSTERRFFESAAPFDAWTHTPASHVEMSFTLGAFTDFARGDRRSNLDRIPAVLDIGTGNGILISRLLNRLARNCHYSGFKLFLLDSSSELLQEAACTCKRLISVPTQVTAIHSAIETLDNSQISMLANKRLRFAVAASCLHHLPRKSKIRTLSVIRRFASVLLLEELEANHDLPKRNSAELVWSVQRFYSALIEAVEKSKLTPEDKRRCIDEFLLAEAIGILNEPAEKRGNHHTLQHHWHNIAVEAGYKVTRSRTKILDSHGLRSLAFRLVSTSHGTEILNK